MPKDSIINQVTSTGWRVTKRIAFTSGSGGNFCTPYEVTSPSGEVAFLKAMDLASEMHDLNRLKQLVDTYVFEQNILEYCKGQKMTKVVSPIDIGTISAPNYPAPLNTVYYIIFALADGDLRSTHLEVDESARRWLPAFVALHHSAVGVNQLHKVEIAHQDIKPSNVLAYTSSLFKISDLGRVVDKKGASPFSSQFFPGDRGYRPIEMHFGYDTFDFSKRLSCDMFMVGSLVFHVIEDVPINVVIIEASRQLHPDIMQLDYRTALPFIVNSFNTILFQFKIKCIEKFGDKIGALLHMVVHEMCHPDPALRGHRKYTNVNARLGLDRYISLLSQVVLNAKIEGVK